MRTKGNRRDQCKQTMIPKDALHHRKKWKCFSFSLRSSVVFNFVEYFISDFCRGYSPVFTVFFFFWKSNPSTGRKYRNALILFSRKTRPFYWNKNKRLSFFSSYFFFLYKHVFRLSLCLLWESSLKV